MSKFIIALLTGYAGCFLGSILNSETAMVAGGLLGFLLPFLVGLIKMEKELLEVKAQNDTLKTLISHLINESSLR